MLLLLLLLHVHVVVAVGVVVIFVVAFIFVTHVWQRARTNACLNPSSNHYESNAFDQNCFRTCACRSKLFFVLVLVLKLNCTVGVVPSSWAILR